MCGSEEGCLTGECCAALVHGQNSHVLRSLGGGYLILKI